MSLNEPYKLIVQGLCSAADERIEQCNQLVRNFQAVYSGIHTYLSRLTPLTEKSSFNSSSPYDTVQWINSYVNESTSFFSQLDQLQENFLKSLESVCASYHNSRLELENDVESARTLLADASNVYVDSYKDYILHCQEMERLNSEMTEAEGSALATLKLKLDEMREECPKIESQAILACEVLGKRKRDVALLMERAIIEYEKNELNFYKSIHDITIPYTTSLNEITKSISTIRSNLIEKQEQIYLNFQQDIEEKSENIQGLESPQNLSPEEISPQPEVPKHKNSTEGSKSNSTKEDRETVQTRHRRVNSSSSHSSFPIITSEEFHADLLSTNIFASKSQDRGVYDSSNLPLEFPESLLSMADLSIPSLSFNVFDYLSWKIVFANDLKAQFVQPKKLIVIPECDIQDGEILQIYGEVGKDKYDLQSERTGFRFVLPKNLFLPVKTYKRIVYKVMKEGSETDINVKIGEYVVGLKEVDDQIKCRTGDGRVGLISKNRLKPAK